MASKLVKLQLPEALYERFKHQAEQSHRTIEDELLYAVSKSNLEEEGLSPALAKELAAMNSFSDNALQKAARSRMPTRLYNKLNDLSDKQQKEGRASLTQEEIEHLNELAYQYDRYILIRSEAAMLLKERGYDVSKIFPKD